MTIRPDLGLSTARIRRRRVRGSAQRSSKLRQATTSYSGVRDPPSASITSVLEGVTGRVLSHSLISNTLQEKGIRIAI